MMLVECKVYPQLMKPCLIAQLLGLAFLYRLRTEGGRTRYPRGVCYKWGATLIPEGLTIFEQLYAKSLFRLGRG